MSWWPFRRHPRLHLGTFADGFPLWPGSLVLGPAQVATHKHLIGVSGVGKSKLMESIFLQLMGQGVGVSFLDPHADSAEAILATLTSRGFFERPDAFERLLYVEFSDEGGAIPFNVLRQPGSGPHITARTVLESFHRAWPALGEGSAPQFDNLVLAGTLVLIQNRLALPALHRLLTDRGFRDGLLANVSDPDIVAFFKERFDRWSKHEAPQMIESTLRRVFLLTFSPVLKQSLGAAGNVLDFRGIMDRGRCVIYNLGRVHDPDARRLLGCLITIGYETAALSRSELEPERRRQHHLLLDEFSDYSAQSEEALSRSLSLTRKFGLFSTLAHQTWSQASQRLQGALQNVGVRIVLRVGRQDAEVLARQVGAVDPLRIKSEALLNRDDEPKGQPVFLELQAQWEEWVRSLTDQPGRHAYVQVAGGRARPIRIRKLATPKVDAEALAAVKRLYRRGQASGVADSPPQPAPNSPSTIQAPSFARRRYFPAEVRS